MQNINVEEIMEQIRAEIKEKGYTQDMLSFEDVPLYDRQEKRNEDLGEFDHVLGQLRNASFIPWRRPLPRGIKGIVKKVICKFVGFLVAPITEDQTDYNQAVIHAFEQCSRIMLSQQAEIEEQKNVIEDLKRQVSIRESM